ncbi:hypothetical protein BaRGS_00014813 [Batillaria attramentaria]|uniref:Uncharacterized protein n=1 Tax=Batillaria attramentaria TaxID=370345 RepID=A0ABD0L324_9CAEN
MKKVKEVLASVKLNHQQTVPGKGTTSVMDQTGGSTNNKGSGLFDKVRNRMRRKTRMCEKCRQFSNTCLPNESFVSGRKHYLCQDCRASSDKMKNMYSQLRRHLGPNEHLHQTSRCSADLLSEQMPSARTVPKESGYETGNSCCSSSSHRNQSCDSTPASVQLHSPTSPANAALGCPGNHMTGSFQKGECNDRGKSNMLVFGAAFTSECLHIQDLHLKSKQRGLYSRQLAARTDRTCQQPVSQYDGYLVTHVPGVQVKYSLGQKSGTEDCLKVISNVANPQNGSSNEKLCSLCKTRKETAFRFPGRTGWLCEDCMDEMM